MSREKQIEEMAKDICDYARGEICILDDKKCDMQCTSAKIAKKLTAKGYRKQSEGEWIWTENGAEDYEQYWLCSCCRNKSYWKSKFCSDCGAKMKNT